MNKSLSNIFHILYNREMAVYQDLKDKYIDPVEIIRETDKLSFQNAETEISLPTADSYLSFL